ncbi:MAG TPA: hypothetical protein VH044_20240 [Polyangiaceae bacterium]|jgi:hypothetical protein|nr:hypothetical protein [Polyangiaceae bacterium]
MAKRRPLVQALREERDEPMDTVVRRFWSQTTPPRVGDGSSGTVVDIAHARAARDQRSGPGQHEHH